MKLSDLEKASSLRYKIKGLENDIKEISKRPICVATNYVDSRPEKLFRIDTPLANAIIAELERQVKEIEKQLKELGVEVDE